MCNRDCRKHRVVLVIAFYYEGFMKQVKKLFQLFSKTDSYICISEK